MLVSGLSAEAQTHSADQNGDYRIDLSELLRVIQFFNSGGYHCEAGSEDGYAAAAGSQACTTHSSDYDGGPDWAINLSELLRLVQFYNTCGYALDAAGEDGFAPVICVWHVKPGGTGTGGTTWDDAFGSIQQAVDAAAAHHGGEVWVGVGTYTGTSDNVVVMREQVQLYGGFAGTESDRDMRDWSAHPTIIDGEGARRCVVGANDATLDGFVVQDGYVLGERGGGMYNAGGSPVVRNCRFVRNGALGEGYCDCGVKRGCYLNEGYGGGMYNSFSSPIIENCVFTENVADGFGGGMYNEGGASPAVTNCTFSGNEAKVLGACEFYCSLCDQSGGFGGGMYTTSGSPVITGCVFSDNRAEYAGGGLYSNDTVALTVTGCTFANNSAGGGAGLLNNSNSAVISNCTFTGNAASDSGGGLNCACKLNMTACTFSNNMAGRGGGLKFSGQTPSTISDCVFTDNSVSRQGGGMFLSGGLALLNCRVSQNASLENGAGIYLDRSSVAVRNTEILGNRAVCGGGLYVDSGSNAFENCVLYANAATYGGGLYIYGATTLTAMNCTLVRNSAQSGRAFYADDKSTPLLTNCILWNDPGGEIGLGGTAIATITYSCVQGGYDGVGNVTEEPLFLDSDSGSLKLRTGSPCIDTGTDSGAPDTDFSGAPRPQGAGHDMGAYEGAVSESDIVHLNIAASPADAGRTVPSAGTHACTRGSIATVAATGAGMRFVRWEGDLPATSSTISVPMDSDKSVTAVFEGNIRYVNAANDSGVEDGFSWATAFREIQAAVDAAAADRGGEVWVAAGTYTGVSGQVLTMLPTVSLYGGFAGIELVRAQRNWAVHRTIIDGEKTRRCLEGSDEARLDGFVLLDGYANQGGGMRNQLSSPVVANCTFDNNVASDGGGMFNNASAPEIVDCVFVGNRAGHSDSSDGGAMYNLNSSPSVIRCDFSGNTAGNAGGVYNLKSAPTVIDSVFSTNSAVYEGGGICNGREASPTVTGCTFSGNSAEIGGGIRNDTKSSAIVANCEFTDNAALGGAGIANSESTLTLINCTFSSGRSVFGGGMYLQDCSTVLWNCSFSGNRAAIGGGVYGSSAALSASNCILWDNGEGEIVLRYSVDINITYSCVQGGYSGAGNIDADPQLLAAENGRVRVRAESPCIDSGTALGAPSTDILGAPRPQGAGVDMGAYEGGVAACDIVYLVLAASPEAGGRTIPAAGLHPCVRGSSIAASAVGLGMRFARWEGDVSSPARDTMILMEGDKAATAVFETNILRVDAANTGWEDGLTWATAFRTIQPAVDIAANNGGGEIWVAQSVYTSTSDPVLTMKSSVALYGGFAGMESSRMERNWVEHPVIIDGAGYRRCVHGADDAILDGFSARNGFGSRSDNRYISNMGGAMLNYCVSPVIANCEFLGNRATFGGGLCNLAAFPLLTNCVFFDNSATAQGGGMDNSASMPVLINCTFSGNVATRGGGMFSGSSSPTVTNSIFWNDIGGDFVNESGSGPIVTFSCIQGGYAGEGNIEADPLFADAVNGDLRLQAGSPCIDTGTGVGAPETDLLGVLRPQGAGYDMGAYEFVPPKR